MKNSLLLACVGDQWRLGEREPLGMGEQPSLHTTYDSFPHRAESKEWEGLPCHCTLLFSVFSTAQKRGAMWVLMLLLLRSIWGRAEV